MTHALVEKFLQFFAVNHSECPKGAPSSAVAQTLLVLTDFQRLMALLNGSRCDSDLFIGRSAERPRPWRPITRCQRIGLRRL